jgi:hypothetical protein
MSNLRAKMLAFRVLAALHAATGQELDESDLIALVAEGKALSPSALRMRCWQIFSANMVVISGTRWVLLTAGVAAVELHLGSAERVSAFPSAPLLSAAKFVGQVALPRTIQNGVTSARPLSLAAVYANVRPDGVTFRSEPSLMGSTRKLPNGEVIQ